MKKNTDVNLALQIQSSPAEIAQNIVNGFIVPILNRKTEVSGFEASEQTFFDTLYLLMIQRLNMEGPNAITEFQKILDDIKEEHGLALEAFSQIENELTSLQEKDFYTVNGQIS